MWNNLIKSIKYLQITKVDRSETQLGRLSYKKLIWKHLAEDKR